MKKRIFLSIIFTLTALSARIYSSTAENILHDDAISKICPGMIYPVSGGDLFLSNYNLRLYYYDGEGDWTEITELYTVYNPAAQKEFTFRATQAPLIKSISTVTPQHDIMSGSRDAKHYIDLQEFTSPSPDTDFTLTLKGGINYIEVRSFSNFNNRKKQPNIIVMNHADSERWNLSQLAGVNIIAQSSSDSFFITDLDFSIIASDLQYHSFSKWNGIYGAPDTAELSWAPSITAQWSGKTFPSETWALLGLHPNKLIMPQNAEQFPVRSVSKDAYLCEWDREPVAQYEKILALEKNTKVKILSIRSTDFIDGILSNWVAVETLPGQTDSNGNDIGQQRGYLFGAWLKYPLKTQDDEILDGAFQKALSPYGYMDSGIFIERTYEIVKNRNLEMLSNLCQDIETYGEHIKVFYITALYNPLNIVIQQNWDEGFDFIANNYPQFLSRTYLYGRNYEFETSPLLEAVQSGNVRAVKLLLQSGQNVNYSVQQKIFTPLKYNLLSVCKNDEIKKILLQNGIETSYKTNLQFKLRFSEGAMLLFKSPYPKSDYDIVRKTSTMKVEMLQMSYESFEPLVTDPKENYVQSTRWIKIRYNGTTGWVAPGDIYIPSSYFEP